MAIKLVSSGNPIVRQVMQETVTDIPSAFEKAARFARGRNMMYTIGGSKFQNFVGFKNETHIFAFHIEKRRRNKLKKTRGHAILTGYIIPIINDASIDFRQHNRHFELKIILPFDLKIKR